MIRALAYAAGLGAILVTSLILVRVLRIERTLAVLLAAVVLACAQAVVAVEALSLAHALSGPALLVLHVGLAMVLLRCGLRPAPPRIGERGAALRSSFAAWRPRAVQVLALGAMAAGLVQLLLVLTVPPNNYDGMQYHLPRALTYLQQGSLDAYTTPDLRETAFPANSEILILWQLALWPAEATAGLVQLLAWAASGAAIFGIGRQLGSSAPASALAALAFMSFPAVLLQASTTQNDLLTACFLLCALFFTAEAGAAPAPGAQALLAGLSLGLAVGTKATALFALPGFALWALAWLDRDRVKRLLRLGAACALGFALLGAYFYVQNLRRFGHPSGPSRFRNSAALDGHEARTLWSNLGRLAFRLLDPGGIAPAGRVGQALASTYQAVTFRAFDVLGIQIWIKDRDLDNEGARWPGPGVFIQEDLAPFGPVLALLGFPALVLACWRGRRHAALAGAAILYLVLVASLLRWQFWHGRILITFAAFVSALLPPLLVRPSRLGGAWSALVALACASGLFVCCVHNHRKPLVGPDAIWGKTRLQRLRIAVSSQESMLRLLDALMPPVSAVTVAPRHPVEARYALFGAGLARRVRPLRLDREDVPPPAGGPSEALLLSGETAAHFADDEASPREQRPFERLDLRPHLERLRRPGSGWRAVADADGGGHLFVPDRGRPVELAPSLPDQLPLNEQWFADGWVGPTWRLLVRFDPARPRLEVAGAMHDHGGASVLRVSAPQGEPLKRFIVAPGPFRIRVPLEPFRRQRPAAYVAIEVTCDHSFNPAVTGGSADNRDLSWRIERLGLVPRPHGFPADE